MYHCLSFFIWSLCHLSYFNLRVLITPLASWNFSDKKNSVKIVEILQNYIKESEFVIHILLCLKFMMFLIITSKIHVDIWPMLTYILTIDSVMITCAMFVNKKTSCYGNRWYANNKHKYILCTVLSRYVYIGHIGFARQKCTFK